MLVSANNSSKLKSKFLQIRPNVPKMADFYELNRILGGVLGHCSGRPGRLANPSVKISLFRVERSEFAPFPTIVNSPKI